MSGEDEGTTQKAPPHTYSIMLEGNVGFAATLLAEAEHKAIIWNRKAVLVLIILVGMPPLLAWLLTPHFDWLGGFLGVVIGWIIGVLGAYVGFKAVVDRVTIQRTSA